MSDPPIRTDSQFLQTDLLAEVQAATAMKPCYGKADPFATFARSMFAGSSNPVLKSTCSWNTRARSTRTTIEADGSSFSTFVCLPTRPAAFCLSAYLSDGMSRGNPLERRILQELLDWKCQIPRQC